MQYSVLIIGHYAVHYIPKLYFMKFVRFDLLHPFCPTHTHSPLATINLFSVSTSLGFLVAIVVLDHTISVFLWLISLSIMPSRSNHYAVTNCKISFFLMAQYFITHTPTQPYLIFFIHSSIDRHSGCFQVFAIINIMLQWTWEVYTVDSWTSWELEAPTNPHANAQSKIWVLLSLTQKQRNW